jgi:Fe-S cluster assembly iron-binding protein IscA
MALDEPKENDLKFEQEGLTFVIDKQLANFLPPHITIGYRNNWLGRGLFIQTGIAGC